MRELYQHLEMDNDYNYYYFDNRDIQWFTKDISKEIDAIFKKHLEKVDTHHSLYILGNGMYFTYNGVKYRHSMTSFIEEETFVPDIIKELKQIKGISNIVYVSGYLD